MLNLVNKSTNTNNQDKKSVRSRSIVIGDILRKKEYGSFDSLRRDTNRMLSRMREDWLREVLKVHGVKHTKSGLTRREIQQNLSENEIRVERYADNGRDLDKVYKENILIGEWNNERKLSIDFDGRLLITIEYYIKPSN